jgi:hypothetical protein
MKTMRERLKLRLRKDRPSSPVTIELPDDVIDDLDEIATALRFAGHHSLIRTYISEGLRRDLEQLGANSDAQPLQGVHNPIPNENALSELLAAPDLKRA